MKQEDLDEVFVLDVNIAMELPGGWTTASMAFGALVDVLDRLEHDGIRPYRTMLEVNERTTR